MDDISENMTSVAPFNLTTIFTSENTDIGNSNSGGLSYHASVVVAVASTLVSFITVFGNVFVFYIICTDRQLRTYTNYYILALSFSDIIAGGFTMPLYSVYWILGYWPFSDMLCDVYLFLNQAFIHISIIMIVTIAYDRWDALEHPFQHLRKRTLHHAMKLIAVSYVTPLLIWFFGSFMWPYLKGSRNILPGRCYPQYVADSFVFLCLAPVIIFWGPFAIICALYARIYKIIRRTVQLRKPRQHPVDRSTVVGSSNASMTMTEIVISKTSEDGGYENPVLAEESRVKENSGKQQNKPSLNIGLESQHQDEMVRKENNRANRTLTLILVAMVISSLPWSALVPVYSTCPSCIPLALYQASVYIAHVNSTLDPFCYAIANPLFREAFLRILCCRRKKPAKMNTSSGR